MTALLAVFAAFAATIGTAASIVPLILGISLGLIVLSLIVIVVRKVTGGHKDNYSHGHGHFKGHHGHRGHY